MHKHINAQNSSYDLKDTLLAMVSYCKAGGAVNYMHYQDFVLHYIPVLQPNYSVLVTQSWAKQSVLNIKNILLFFLAPESLPMSKKTN